MLIDQGVSPTDVAREPKVSTQSASRWHVAWSKCGTKAPAPASRAGRKPQLPMADPKRLERALRRDARANLYPTELWTH